MHMLYTARLEKCEGVWVWSVIEATGQGLFERARGVHEKAETAALLASAALRMTLVVDGVDGVDELTAALAGASAQEPSFDDVASGRVSLEEARRFPGRFDPVHMGC